MSDEAPPLRISAALAWIGLILFLGWQEFFVETEWRWVTPWWFRIPATVMLGLVLLVFALECLQDDMTVRRWATSLLVFAVFGVLFLAIGIVDPEKLQLPRWLLLSGGLAYLAAALAAGVAAKDSWD